MTKDIEAIGLMCDDAEIAQYQTEGLPADQVSAENAAIVVNTTRYPLMVDPQLQAIYWIKRREGEKLGIGRLGQKHLVRNLLKAIEDGTPFIIENMGEAIDPTLMPVIGRTTIKRGKRKFVAMETQKWNCTRTSVSTSTRSFPTPIIPQKFKRSVPS